MIAYTYLHPGRVGQFAAVRWPDPGAWLEADLDSCPTVIHAALPNGLPVWVAEELWEVELDGEIVLEERHAVAERGRLVRRIESWNGETARRFGEACAAEARRRVTAAPELSGYADDAEVVAGQTPPVAAYIAARVAELQDGPEGYDAERDRQAAWLRDALGLNGTEEQPMSALVRRHPLVAFFVLTFVLTWSIVPIGSFFAPGPLVAAIVVTAVVAGRAGLRTWGSRLMRWRVHPVWYVVAVAVPLATLAAAAGSNIAFGAPTGAVHRLDAWYVLIGTFAGRLVIPLMAPLGEEPGWRGFALPRLQANASPLRATLVLAPLVVVWHVPLIFLASEDLAPILLVATLAVTFFYTWLYNRTGGSVLLTIVAHAAEGTIKLSAFGFVSVYDSRLPYLYTIAWSVVAVGLLVVDRRFWTGRRASGFRNVAVAPSRSAAY